MNLDILQPYEADFTVPKLYTKPKNTSTSPTVQVNNRFAVLTTDWLSYISDEPKYNILIYILYYNGFSPGAPNTEASCFLTSSTPAALTE